MSDALRASLFGLNRARLITAVVALAVGGLLRQAGAFPYPFGPSGWPCSPRSSRARFSPWPRRSSATCAASAASSSRSTWRSSAPSSPPAAAHSRSSSRSTCSPCWRPPSSSPRAGALAVAGLSSVFYVAVVLGPDALASLRGLSGRGTTTDEALAICLNAAVFLVVGFVTSSLAGRNRESQAHLDAHRKHLSDLQAFRDLIFESVGSGLVGVDPRGRVTAFNRAAESITGFRSADALGQPWSAIFGSGVDLDEIRETANEDQSPPRALRVPAPRGRTGASSPSASRSGPCAQATERSRVSSASARTCPRSSRWSSACARPTAWPRSGGSPPTWPTRSAIPSRRSRGPWRRSPRTCLPTSGRNRLVEIVLRESERLNHIVGAFLEYARPAPLTPIDVDLAQILDEVLLLIEHRSLPANLKIIREYGGVAARAGRPPADAAGDLEPLSQRGAGHARRRRDARRRTGAGRTRARADPDMGRRQRSRASPTRTCPTSSSRSTRPRPGESAWP